VAVTVEDSAKSIAENINALGITGLKATAEPTRAYIDYQGITDEGDGEGLNFSITIGDKTVKVNKDTVTDLTTATANDAAVTAIGTYLSQEFGTGVTVTVDSTTNTQLNIVVANGDNVVVNQSASSVATTGALTFANGNDKETSTNTTTDTADDLTFVTVTGGAASTVTAFGNLKIESDGTHAGDIKIEGLKTIGLTAADPEDFVGGKIKSPPSAANSDLKSVSEIDVSTFEGAQLAIAIAQAGINTINSEMARYGALQTRFENTIGNLEINVENTTNARSRIEDADYAAETANMSRDTILQQAGIAMLAQANQQPQLVLSLIQ
jgi:flagellin